MVPRHHHVKVVSLHLIHLNNVVSLALHVRRLHHPGDAVPYRHLRLVDAMALYVQTNLEIPRQTTAIFLHATSLW
jgi:hypothetical protein